MRQNISDRAHAFPFRRFLGITCVAVITATAGGFGIGYTAKTYVMKQEQRRIDTTQFTIVDADHVVYANGDTVRRDPRRNIRLIKINEASN